MTPHEVAMRMIRQRGTTAAHPAFITAYLRAELDRDPRAFETELQRRLRGIVASFTYMGLAFAAVTASSVRAAARFERARADVEAAMAR